MDIVQFAVKSPPCEAVCLHRTITVKPDPKATLPNGIEREQSRTVYGSGQLTTVEPFEVPAGVGFKIETAATLSDGSTQQLGVQQVKAGSIKSHESIVVMGQRSVPDEKPAASEEPTVEPKEFHAVPQSPAGTKASETTQAQGTQSSGNVTKNASGPSGGV